MYFNFVFRHSFFRRCCRAQANLFSRCHLFFSRSNIPILLAGHCAAKLEGCTVDTLLATGYYVKRFIYFLILAKIKLYRMGAKYVWKWRSPVDGVLLFASSPYIAAHTRTRAHPITILFSEYFIYHRITHAHYAYCLY